MNRFHVIRSKQLIMLGIQVMFRYSLTNGANAKPASCSCHWNANNSLKRMAKIIGGDDVSTASYPFMAGLFEAEGEFLNSVQCGAVVINRFQLLTAAHCINPSANYSIVAGVSDLQKADMRNIRKVLRVDVHAEFNEKSLSDDLAILTIDRPFEFSLGTTAAACLSTDQEKNNSQYRVLGWGYLRNSTITSHLQEATVAKYNYLKCHQQGLTRSLKRKQFCTLSKNRGPCLGDSGGPVLSFHNDKRSYILVGIISKGPEDCRTLPSVHTAIQHPDYIYWIKEKSIEPLCLVD